MVGYCLVIYAIAFTSLALAFSSPRHAEKLRDFIPISLIVVMLISAYVLFQIHYKGAYRTDALAFTHYAADLFVQKGLNPYPLDLQDALYRFKVDPLYITLTPSGDISTNLAYPALHFLAFVPFVAVGLEDMRWIIFLFEIATAVTLYYNAPRELRPIVLLPIFVSADLAIDFNAGSVTDFLWVLPMVWVALSMDNPFRSGIFYGIAGAVKQIPWIVAPFMIIRMFNLKEGSLIVKASNILKFLGAMAISFTLPNLLFIVKDAGAWFSGILIPASGELALLSQGLSMLTQAEITPLPSTFYLGTTAALFLALVANYFVYFDKLKHLIWVFPAVTMWFSHRALQNYFMYWIPVMLAEVLVMHFEQRNHE